MSHRDGAAASPNQLQSGCWIEKGLVLAREDEMESLLAIGKGFVASRGSLAEGSARTAATSRGAAQIVAAVGPQPYFGNPRIETHAGPLSVCCVTVFFIPNKPE